MIKILSPQFIHVLQFELSFFLKRKSSYILLLLFVLLGFVAGSRFTAFSAENTYRNAPFVITFMLGLMSLMCIFSASILAAQVLFREKDNSFSLVLYATPIQKMHYMLSRFGVVFGITAFIFLLFTISFSIGQQMSIFDKSEFGVFNFWHYLHPYLLLTLPNAFFCSAVVCSVGWLSKNKLAVYITGFFLYIAYIVSMLFSGSPMMAGNMMPSYEAMNLSAQFDPFGLSAFFQQTLNWSGQERNTLLPSLAGNMLFNRLFFSILSLLLLLLAFLGFKFSLNEKSKRQKAIQNEASFKVKTKAIPPPQYFDKNHRIKSVTSFVKMDLLYAVKSIPFVLILIGIGFFIAMEIYSDIDKGIRLPENYATTALMVNTIITTFPFLCALILLFYSSEMLWRSRDFNFHLIENATPLDKAIPFIAKWLSLSTLAFLFLLWAVLIGIFFQISYQYPLFEWAVYGQLFYLVGMPLVLSAGLIVFIQNIINNKYIGLSIATLVILVTSTSVGKMIGIHHPLLRFTSPFNSLYSEMNGFGAYLDFFNCKMLFGMCVMLFSVELMRCMRLRYLKSPLLWGLAVATILSGGFIYNKVALPNEKAALNWQAAYETKYRPYQNLPQPTVTDVKTSIDLFPERHAYKVTGRYILHNKTDKTIEKLLFFMDKSLGKAFSFSTTEGVLSTEKDIEFGHYWLILAKPLQPKDSLKTDFQFDYTWDGFSRHEPFNAIVGNGAFMRLSNYFPRLGYQSQLEIEKEDERKRRNLGKNTPLLTLNDPRSPQNNLIQLEATISTTKGQTAIGVGDLVNTWETSDRAFFQYKTNEPIAFRFGVSSGNYALAKRAYRGITIEVYYHPIHAENVQHLIENAAKTYDYCTSNFGEYPFKTIRFAEISSFTNGFAATAYPATIFMTENMVFHANIKGDKQQDVINELAGHEFAHEWWGAHQVIPDNREGAKFLTETLAMYTELMLVKKMYGQKRVLENVALHEDLYLRDRGYADEQPLYKTLNDNVHQHYSKGLVTMYQLSEKLGEDKVNNALKNLFQRSKSAKFAPIATDFLEELYAIPDTNQKRLIDDLFKHITTYNFKTASIQTVENNNVYKVDFTIEAFKYRENGKDNKSVIPFNDNLEIAFHFNNQADKIVLLPIKNGLNSIQFEWTEKPISMTIDPHFRFIKLGGHSLLKI
jgi:hypothetical protein